MIDCDGRPGHPPDRTVCGDRRSRGCGPHGTGPAAPADRCGAGLPGGGAGSAGVRQRAPVDPVRLLPAGAPASRACRAKYRDRAEQLDRIVDEALAQEDSWDGLVLYVERMNTFLDADRGLRAMVMTTREGAETWAEGRVKRSPRVDKLIARAKKDGYLRPDAERSDLFLIDVMIDAVRDYTANVDAEQWHRCLALVLEGLRSRPDQLPLPGEPMSRAGVAAAMRDVGQRRAIGRPPR
jgi:Transcriptional regulator SbtR-like, C-terminal domain